MESNRYVVVREHREVLGDHVDHALDKLRVIHLALSAGDTKGILDDEALIALAAVLDSAISDLEPVRDVLQGTPPRHGSVSVLYT